MSSLGRAEGGGVAMNMNSGSAKLVLLFPGWKKWKARTVKPGTIILHSRADEIVPFASSEELVRNSGLPAVGTDRGPATITGLQILSHWRHC